MAGRLERIAWSTAPEVVKALLSAYSGGKLLRGALTSLHTPRTSDTAVRAATLSERACMLALCGWFQWPNTESTPKTMRRAPPEQR